MEVQEETYNKLWPILTALTVCLGSFVFGTVIGYLSPSIPNLDDNPNPFHINEEQYSWVAGIMCLGATVGGLAGGPLMDKFGRKMGLMYVSVPFAFSWVVIAASPNFACLMLGQMMIGVCTGIFSVICPVYIGEISPASIRGLLGSCHQLAACLGMLFAYGCGAVLTWYWLAIACQAVIFVMIVFLALIPESPRWLLSIGRNKDAEYALLWLHGQDYDVVHEMTILQEAICSSRENVKFSEFLEPHILKPLLISLFLMTFQQFCGINVVIAYTVDIFRMTKISMDSYLQAIVVGVVSVLGTLVSVFASDLAGRRVLLVTSALIMTISIGGLGAYFYELDTRQEFATGTLSWVPVTCMVVFTFGYHTGFGPIPWLMMGELFPLRAKGIATSMAITCNWFFTFITAKFFVNMTNVMMMAGGYWFFAGFCALSIPLVLFIPETKGKTLEEVELIFRKCNPKQ